MDERPDMELLREYASRGTERAFEVVVSRHLDLVYHAALRQTGQPEMAKDVAQTVFTLLAQKAGRLSSQTVVAGWLVKTTRFVSARAVRNELRHRRRNEEAARMNIEPSPDAGEEMTALLPLLDQSLASLRGADRDALVLRYLEGKSFFEMAGTLGTTEEAARKRVQRALERLRHLLGRRGFAVGTTALAAVLETLSTQAAPAGFVAVIASAAMQQAAGVAAVSLFSSLSLSLSLMNITQTKIAAATALALVGIGAIVVHSSRPSPAPPAQPAPPAESSALAIENRRLSEELQKAAAENARLASSLDEAGKIANSYRELAEKVKTENPTAIEEYPTPRHVIAGFGEMARVTKEVMAINPKTAQEISAHMDRTIEMGKMAPRLLEAMRQLGMGEGWKDPAPPEDQVSCFLYGALDLTEPQFVQMETVLRNHFQSTGRKAPNAAVLANALRDGGEPLGILDAGTFQQIMATLTPEQRAAFERFSGPKE